MQTDLYVHQSGSVFLFHSKDVHWLTPFSVFEYLLCKIYCVLCVVFKEIDHFIKLVGF